MQEYYKYSRDKYLIDQETWIKENNIRIGDLVRLKNDDYGSRYYDKKGWNNSWVDEMLAKRGETLRIRQFKKSRGIMLDDDFFYPYYALSPVKKKTLL